MMDRLSFVIAGVQKAGTTSLDAILRRHPQIQMARVKETHFFDDESRDWSRADYADLDAHFALNDARLRGETTPITLYWRPAIRRLRAYNGQIKIILMLRQPAARAFSNWRHEHRRRRETLPFGEAIRSGRDRVRRGAETEGLHRIFAYVERSLYGDQLAYLCEHFARGDIHCEIYEEFFHDRPAGLRRIAGFLGVDPFPEGIPDFQLNRGEESIPSGDLSDEDAGHLDEIFREQIGAVETFLGRPIPAWRGKPE